MTAPFLELEAVTVRLGGATVLNNISLTLEDGACHAIIGPNGAGKTTLLDLVTGTIRPHKGRILLSGHDITATPIHRRARLGIARTWQHPNLCGNLTVIENLLIGLRSASGTRQNRHVAAILDEAGLADAAPLPARHLSYGQQRRLELAIALATTPRLLLLDEPSAGLSPDNTGYLIDQLTSLRDTTIVLVEHDIEITRTIADGVSLLSDGLLHAMSTPPPSAQTTEPQRSPEQGRHRPARGGRPVLAVRNLSVRRGTRQILTAVDIDVRPGEVVAVTGRNGAGKSTLLHAIAGLIPTDATGQIHINGQDISGLGTHERARLGVALVPQSRRLFAHLSVAENLTVATRANARYWTIDLVLNALPALRSHFHQPAASLSGGEQQQLTLARALISGPRLLLLDEPFDGLTRDTARHVLHVIRACVDHGAAVLLIDHDAARLSDIGDRTLTINAGRLQPSRAHSETVAHRVKGRGNRPSCDTQRASQHQSDAESAD